MLRCLNYSSAIPHITWELLAIPVRKSVGDVARRSLLQHRGQHPHRAVRSDRLLPNLRVPFLFDLWKNLRWKARNKCGILRSISFFWLNCPLRSGQSHGGIARAFLVLLLCLGSIGKAKGSIRGLWFTCSDCLFSCSRASRLILSFVVFTGTASSCI